MSGAIAGAGGLRTLFTLPDAIHGKGKVVFAWNADGTLLCSSGSNGLVYIHSRDGRKICDVLLESRAPCVALDWDKDGEAVAIVQSGVDRIAIWEVSSRSVFYVDSGLKDPSWAKWSKVGPQLAVGSSKGALMIFRKDTRKKHFLPNKHSKAIVCGDWSSDNKLALGSSDVMLTISNADGDTIEQVELKYPPEAVQFATEKSDAVYASSSSGRASPAPADGTDTTVSVNMGGNTILLYNLLKPSEPAELLFQQRYGRIVSYRWFGDGYVMLGFSEGFVVVISTHKDEIKEEVFSGRFHKEALEDIACSVPAQRAASAGGNTIKLLDMTTWKELKGEFASVDPAHGPITSLAWTPDGQILTASTRSGHLYSFLGKVPSLVSSWTGGGGGEGPYASSKLAYMSSLKEVSVLALSGKGFVDEEAPPIVVPIAVEPDLIAVGPLAVGVAMNNRAWYYRATNSSNSAGNVLLLEKDYPGTVDEIKLTSSHAVVKSMGRLHVHPLAPASASTSSPSADPTTTSYSLPLQEGGGGGGGGIVTCFAVAGNEFVVFGTSLGRVEMFSLSDGKMLASHEYRGAPASAGAVAPPSIRGVFPNAIGTRIIILDDAGRSFLFNPVDGKKLSLEGILPPNLVGAAGSGGASARGIGGGANNGGSSVLSPILWDCKDRNVFVTVGVGARRSYASAASGVSSPTSSAAMAAKAAGAGGGGMTLEVSTFLYTPGSMMGPSMTQLGSLDIQDNGDMVVDPLSTYLPSLHCAPLALQGGVLSYHSASPPPSSVASPTTAAAVAAAQRRTTAGGGHFGSSSAGSIMTVALETHNALPSLNTAVTLSDPAQVKHAFSQCLQLSRLQEAWTYAVALNNNYSNSNAAGPGGSNSSGNSATRPIWMALSGKAMELLEVELAQRVYRLVGDAGMVAALEQIAKLDDKQAVAGHMALLFGDLPVAQEIFLSSSSPAIALLALDMRKDLLQWDVALRLAETLSPDQVPSISLDFARQLEVKGDYGAALTMYQQALTKLAAAPAQQQQQLKGLLHAGLTRMTLRQGDLRKGIAMALESGDKVLCRDCAAILEGMKQYADAATLYKQAEMWEKAVALLLQGKNFSAAGQLMDRITTPKLHAIYAKACEAGKNYSEAAKAYERARDMDAVVRILLNHLDSPEKAAAIVRQTRSAEGAALLAKYCVSNGDFRGAIEFLLLAKRREDAFNLACQHDEMDLYVQALKLSLAATAAGIDLAALLLSAAAAGTGGSGIGAAGEAALANVVLPRDECIKIAGYYEKKGDLAGAAGMYAAIPSSSSSSSADATSATAEEDLALYTKALKLYLQVASKTVAPPPAAGAPPQDPAAVAATNKYIDRAIEVVGKAKNDKVTRILIDYLMGESDGIPKDPRHIFRLYMALGNYPQAAKTALIIARQEQDLGNYKVAHDVLFDTYRDLSAQGVKVSADLVASLTLLHSYLLVKRLVKLENHDAAAAMMVRVASNVSRFPQHVVPILTSTVIECQRAGLKRSAYDYSVMLMRPEHRDAVEPKFYKKIEALVRRPSTEEADQGSSACPFCERNVSTYALSCDFCKSRLPFCIVSGKHMTTEDCSCCPSCKFPALLPALQSYLTIETSCPMCNNAISPDALALVPDPASFLRKVASAVTGEGGGGGGVGAGGDGDE